MVEIVAAVGGPALNDALSVMGVGFVLGVTVQVFIPWSVRVFTLVRTAIGLGRG